MKIIILGVGKVGSALAESFCAEGHEVCLIDQNEQKISEHVNKIDASGVIGNGLNSNTLIEAGASEVDFFVACTSWDETNILSCVLAKKLGAKFTIARVRAPQYFSDMENLRNHLGLDMVFNPERRTAKDIFNVLKFPFAESIENFAGGRALLIKLEVKAGNPMIDKTLIDISKEYNKKVLFAVVIRDGRSIIPKGDFAIKENDEVYIIGSEQEITAFSKAVKIFKHRAKQVLIVGASTIAHYLSNDLLSVGASVTVIEKDAEKCNKLSQEISGVNVVLGDGSNHDVLGEEGLKTAGALVTLTGLDEQNIIISLYAKQSEGIKTITKVDKGSMESMIKSLGLDSIVSPKDSIANHIITFVRAHHEHATEELCSLYKLASGIEAMEFKVPESFACKGKMLKQMKIRKSILIGGIVRNGEFIFPSGDTVINVGDRVIVISDESKISEIKDILRK